LPSNTFSTDTIQFEDVFQAEFVCVCEDVSDGHVIGRYDVRVSIKVVDINERITCLCLEKRSR
jgi:hypothetical protein